MSTLTRVSDNSVVALEYTLTVDDELVDFSEEGEPLEYLHGHGNIVPGLERELTGMGIGDSKKVTVSPQDGYGLYDEEALAYVPRIEFPAEIPIEIGVELQVRDEDGDVTGATIVWVGADEVQLDFNHPLAGKELHFDVTVMGLRQPTPEELEHGHVHPHGRHH